VYDKPVIIIGTGIEKEQNIILSRCIHQLEKSKYSQQPVHTKGLSFLLCAVQNLTIVVWLPSIHVHIGNALLFG
jgi:hypothetical protein